MSWLFGSKQDKERKKALKAKEHEAYMKGYESAKIQAATKRGKRAGSTTFGERLSGSFSGLERSMAASNRMADSLLGGFGGFGSEPPRRKKRKR